jgi:hypothetical protein
MTYSCRGTTKNENDDKYEPRYCHQHTETHIKFVHHILENILLVNIQIKHVQIEDNYAINSFLLFDHDNKPMTTETCNDFLPFC